MKPPLVFSSTSDLEVALDGSNVSFARYFFAIYHVPHDEPSGIVDYRERLKRGYPKCVIPKGGNFILVGRAAFLALAAYYQTAIGKQSLPADYRTYTNKRLEEITQLDRDRRELDAPVMLTEGQLAHDPMLAMPAHAAIRRF